MVFSTWFANVDLSYKFALFLGAAIILTFIAGFLKLWYTTRWTTRMQLKEDTERATKTTEKTGIKKDLGAGDLFGVRAIEKGFYGGVSQVDLHATPTRTMKPGGLSATSSLIGSPNANDSVISLFNQPANQNAAKNSNRLQPSVAELQRTGQYDPAVDMSRTMPPSPTRDSYASSSAPAEPSRLTKPGRSYDPQPAQNGDSHKNSSPSTPILGSTESLMNNDAPNHGRQTSQTRRSAPPPPHTSKANRESLQSASTSSDDSLPGTESPAPTVALRVVSGFYSNAIVGNYFDEQSSRQSEHATVETQARRESVISNRRASQIDILKKASQSVTPIPERSPDRRARSSSSSDRKISRTADSVKMPSNPMRQDKGKEIERQRDLLHYDPSSSRMRSGSIQGNAVNFDTPRDSPFSDLHKTASHTTKQSISSAHSTESHYSADSRSDSEAELEHMNKNKFTQIRNQESVHNPTYQADSADVQTSAKRLSRYPAMASVASGNWEPTRNPERPTVSSAVAQRRVPQPLDLVTDMPPPRVGDLNMAPSPMELIQRWAEEEGASVKTPLGMQKPLSAEDRAKVVMQGINMRGEGKSS